MPESSEREIIPGSLETIRERIRALLQQRAQDEGITTRQESDDRDEQALDTARARGKRRAGPRTGE